MRKEIQQINKYFLDQIKKNLNLPGIFAYFVRQCGVLLLAQP